MRRYIKSLDGIRGFGIFFVLGYHYLRLNDYDGSVLGFSWIWIQMFFVQSGFLITEILLDSKNKPFLTYTSQFYWRRALRIFPVYFAYLLVFAVAYMVLHKPDDFAERAPYLLTFTYNFTRFIKELELGSVWFIHFWSLAVEEQFYLIWPLVVYFLDKAQLKKLVIFILIATPLFRYWFAHYILGLGYSEEMTGEITYAFTISQFDAFAMGAAIPLFNLQERITKPGRWSLLVVAIVLIVGMINYMLIQKSNPDFSVTSLGVSVAMIKNLQHVWSYSLINILFVLVILYLVSKEYKGLFNNFILVNIGKIVYGLYIFHFAVLFVMSIVNKKYIGNFMISFTIAFVIVYVLAFISYNYYEKKFLALKDLWNRNK